MSRGRGNGIRALRDVQSRCVLTGDGCWHWPGATATSGSACRVPVAWFPAEGRIVSVLRISLALIGKPVVRGQLVWRTCGCSDCVRPGHLLAGTRADMGRWFAAQGTLKGDPRRPIINRRNRLGIGGSSVTMETAAWARESPQTGAAVAHALDVSPTVVSRIRKRRTFAPEVQQSSIFALGTAAANAAEQQRRAA